MAGNAVARETLVALRHQIARIEGRPAEHLDDPGEPVEAENMVVRSNALATRGELLETGIEGLDRVLGGGLPRAALTEIHGVKTSDAASVAGFMLALATRFLRQAPAPLLWIGTSDIFREAGFPYAPGLLEQFGIAPESLIFANAMKPVDALWVAEEAAPLGALSAVLLELRGNLAKLDLTATRRLHRRAQLAGRPVFLLRHAVIAEPTAAPIRLIVAPAPAAPRRTLAGTFADSIGQPVFNISVSKNRAAPEAQFQVEWNPNEFIFEEIPTQILGVMVPLSERGEDTAAASWSRVALEPRLCDAADFQPDREEQPAYRNSRRTG